MKELRDEPFALLNTDLLVYMFSGCSKLPLFKPQDCGFKVVELEKDHAFYLFIFFRFAIRFGGC